MNRLTISMILTLGALISAAVPAAAQVSDKVVVKYSDLNLSTQDGVLTFHQRLQRAITQVCGDFDAGDPVRSGPINACRDQVQLTVARIERQKIAAAYAAKAITFAQGTPIQRKQ
jgi:UrcA family protein